MSKQQNRTISSRIPNDLHRAVEMWACDNNVCKSESLRIALDLLVSPANRKEELFDRLKAIEGKLDRVDTHTKHVSVNIDVVRELIASLAKYVFFYAVQPDDKNKSKENMDARFERYIKMVTARVRSKALHFEMSSKDDGGFL